MKERIADREPQPLDSIVLHGDENDPHSELGLYLKIDEYVREYYAKYNAVRKGMGFVMEVYRKRLTSSFYAIKLSLERRKARLAEALRTGDYVMLLGLATQEQADSEDEEDSEEAEETIDPSKLRSDQMRAVIQAEHDFLEGFITQLKNVPTIQRLITSIRCCTPNSTKVGKTGHHIQSIQRHRGPSFGVPPTAVW